MAMERLGDLVAIILESAIYSGARTAGMAVIICNNPKQRSHH